MRGPGDHDRIYTNESDGQKFYGYDNGTTDWYTEDGTLYSYTETPSDDDDW